MLRHWLQRFRQKNGNKTIPEAAEQVGIPYTSLHDRLKLGNCPTPITEIYLATQFLQQLKKI
jgi:hypothetical protein